MLLRVKRCFLNLNGYNIPFGRCVTLLKKASSRRTRGNCSTISGFQMGHFFLRFLRILREILFFQWTHVCFLTSKITVEYSGHFASLMMRLTRQRMGSSRNSMT